MAGASSIFSGGSRFSTDFQSVITRSVAIASLPLSQLNAQKTTLDGQSAAIVSLESKFTSLKTAIGAIHSALNPGAYDVSNSNAGVGSATLGVTVLEGSYRINVSEIGAHTISVSNASLPDVSDPSTQNISSSGSFTLTVDGTPVAITPAGGSLSALAEAINDADAGVSATIVNLGSTSSPEYRLSLQSDKYAPVAISLHDGSVELVSEVVTGVKAGYQVNGIPTTIETDSRTVTLAPGLTVNLAGEGDATFTIERSRSAIQNGLTSFVKAYNAAVDELDSHRGSGKGALKGQSLVFTLADSLRDVAGYSTSPSDVDSLTKLGIEFDKDGHLSFNTTTFDSLAGDAYDAVKSFLGDKDSSGFLKTADDVLSGLVENGIVDDAAETVADQIANQNSRIEETEARIDRLRQSLEGQFAATDSLIANLEQRVLFVQGLFSSFFKSSD